MCLTAGPSPGTLMTMKSVINKRLAALEPGEGGRIVSVAGAPGSEERLADLGFVSGTDLRVIRVAPLGDPVEIEIRGTRLCLRRRDLEQLRVEVPA